MKKFIMMTVLVASVHALGCEVSSTNLEDQNYVSCENESGAKIFDFAYKATKEQELMISWEAEACGSKTVDKYEWLTYNTNGNLESSEDVNGGTFFSHAGKNHILRVHVSDVSACPYYNLNFGIQAY